MRFCIFHEKLHERTSTLWTLCAALNESLPINLRLRLGFLDFHSKLLIAEMGLLRFYRRLILLFREYYRRILFLQEIFYRLFEWREGIL